MNESEGLFQWFDLGGGLLGVWRAERKLRSRDFIGITASRTFSDWILDLIFLFWSPFIFALFLWIWLENLLTLLDTAHSSWVSRSAQPWWRGFLCEICVQLKSGGGGEEVIGGRVIEMLRAHHLMQWTVLESSFISHYVKSAQPAFTKFTYTIVSLKC